MVNLKNKWVLITGASRGIGRLSALFLADMLPFFAWND